MGSSTEKILGYILLCLGLICIIFAAYSLYQVFTNAANPPEIFQMKSLSFSLSFGADKTPTQVTLPLDSEMKKMMNIGLYSLFMLFLVSIGGKISSIGVQLIKTITKKD